MATPKHGTQCEGNKGPTILESLFVLNTDRMYCTWGIDLLCASHASNRFSNCGKQKKRCILLCVHRYGRESETEGRVNSATRFLALHLHPDRCNSKICNRLYMAAISQFLRKSTKSINCRAASSSVYFVSSVCCNSHCTLKNHHLSPVIVHALFNIFPVWQNTAKSFQNPSSESGN